MRNTNKIAVIKMGQLVEVGTHGELMQIGKRATKSD